MADSVPAKFLDLATISSDWMLNCAVHGNVQMVIVFNNDLVNRSYCQQCWEESSVSKVSKKVTFVQGAGPAPAPAITR